MRRAFTSALLALLAARVLAEDAADEAAPPPKLNHTFTRTSIKAPFLEQFTDDWSDRWTPSEATKKTPVGGETFSYVGIWEVEESSVYPVIAGDKGLVAKTKAAHHAISAPLKEPVSFADKPLVVQYEAKFQNGGNCGGGYLKLLEDGFQNAGQEFSDKTPWVIMFGPDLTCPGSKVHFIFRHKNPLTGEYEEKHLKLPPTPVIDKTTNLFTLIVNPDNTFKVLVNGDQVKTGSLLEDFTPPVNPPAEIDDPEDKKPEDWVDAQKIDDPDAVKPEDWDEDAPYEILDEEAEKPEGWLDNEPATIADPDAEKPEEWDDEEDGDWVAPTIRNSKCDDAPGCGEWSRPYKPNPDYKGKWYAPRIDNPAYIGPWKPARIPNPDFFEDLQPGKSLNKIGAVGIEIWTMTEDILFDNIYIGYSEEDAKSLAAESFDIKRASESEQHATKPPAPAAEGPPTLKENPIAFIQDKVLAFVDIAKQDPLEAFKTHPETGGALVIAVITLFSMFGALFGIVGGASKPAPKVATKKVDAAEKPAEKAPVAPAGGDKKEDGGVKKRK